MARIILITGGARSGKSSCAQKMAESFPGTRAFIATCPTADQMLDDEMRQRIERHRQQRLDGGWQTIEETLDLAERLAAGAQFDLLLVDCLTLWVNNLMARAQQNLTEDDLVHKCEELLTACRQHRGTIFFVTNEVGTGIVPENTLARQFRDLVGRCNQVIAAGADQVVLVTSGIPLTIKEG